ncbi:MAG TPA: hypothetical protein VGH24_05315, partial [Solirubrobacteraceae bacterium]
MTFITWSAAARRGAGRLPAVLTMAFAAFAMTASGASALTSHGQLLHLAPHARANTNTSGNWF